MEIRARAPEAAADIERTLAECRRIEAPAVECFLRPFIEVTEREWERKRERESE